MCCGVQVCALCWLGPSRRVGWFWRSVCSPPLLRCFGLGPSFVSALFSPCLPFSSCFPLFDGVSAFPKPCLPLSPRMCDCVGWRSPCHGWCVRLPEVLSPCLSHCIPTCLPVLDGYKWRLETSARKSPSFWNPMAA